MAIQTVGSFRLAQQGFYVAKTHVPSNTTGDELIDQTYTTDPGSLGVPDGSVLWFKLIVVAGYDVQSPQGFMYVSGNPNIATFTCTNITVAPHLTYNGIVKP
jgi:hypothetical protein